MLLSIETKKVNYMQTQKNELHHSDADRPGAQYITHCLTLELG